MSGRSDRSKRPKSGTKQVGSASSNVRQEVSSRNMNASANNGSEVGTDDDLAVRGCPEEIPDDECVKFFKERDAKRVDHDSGRPAAFSQRDVVDDITGEVLDIDGADGGEMFPDDDGVEEFDDMEEDMDDEQEEDVNEIVVLAPDHRLMTRFQARLKKHLEAQKYKLSIEMHEVTAALKTRKKEREDVGVDLYGQQQELARYQAMLEKYLAEFVSVQADRISMEQELEEERTQYRNKLSQLSKERQKGVELQAEAENVNLRMFYMNTTKVEMDGDIAVMKRAAERATFDNTKAEIDKKNQDLFVNRMVERLEKLREDIAMHDAQLAAQAMETREAREALAEATMEIEAITLEKKQLFQQWSSSLIGMKRRDEAYAAMVCALNEQEQRIQTLDTELTGFKKSTQKEQEQNEKMMATLSKMEADVTRVRQQLATCLAEHDALKVEYSMFSKILKETEDAFAKVGLERTLCTNELMSLRKNIERQYQEKIRLEDGILSAIRDKMTIDKSAQYTENVMKKIRDRTKELEGQIAQAENDTAKTLLESAQLETRIDSQMKIRDEVDTDMKAKSDSLAKSEMESKKRCATIEHKQNDIDLVNKKLEALISAAGGKELSPLEIEISSLQKSIKQEQQEIENGQQSWLREQAELVEYSRVQAERSEAIEMLLKKMTILSQKKLRLETDVETQNRELNEINRDMHIMQNDMIKLNTLISKQRGSEETLQRDNILTENRFMADLRAAEKESIEMEERLERVKEEKEQELNALVEAERQIMLWEKKTQLARETRATVEADVGQGDVYMMKTEIHRMQLRLQQLTRQQEKTIVEMEKAVSFRDIIVTRGEATAKSAAKGVLTRNSYHKQLDELKKKIKQTGQAATECDAEIAELRRQQNEMSEQIDGCQTQIQQLQAASDMADGELEQLQAQRAYGLSELVARQRRVKYYQQLIDGKYTRLIKTDSALDIEHQKQTDRINNLTAIVDRLIQEYPHAQPALKKVSSAFAFKTSV